MKVQSDHVSPLFKPVAVISPWADYKVFSRGKLCSQLSMRVESEVCGSESWLCY